MKKLSCLSSHPTTFPLPAHIGEVIDLAWAPDGNNIAAVTRWGYLCVWSTIDGALFLHKRLTRTGLLTVSWARQGSALAVGGMDGRLYRVEHLKTKEMSVLSYPFQDPVTKIAWSPSPVGRCLVVAGSTLTVLNEGGRAPLRVRYSAPIWDAAWACDGRTFAVLCRDGLVEIWDASLQRARCSLTDIAEPRCLSWHPDGRQLAVGTMTGQVQVCDLHGQKLQRTPRLSPFPLAAVRWGKAYLAAVSDQGIALWDGVAQHPLDMVAGERVIGASVPLVLDPHGEQMALSIGHAVSITSLA